MSSRQEEFFRKSGQIEKPSRSKAWDYFWLLLAGAICLLGLIVLKSL